MLFSGHHFGAGVFLMEVCTKKPRIEAELAGDGFNGLALKADWARGRTQISSKPKGLKCFFFFLDGFSFNIFCMFYSSMSESRKNLRTVLNAFVQGRFSSKAFVRFQPPSFAPFGMTSVISAREGKQWVVEFSTKISCRFSVPICLENRIFQSNFSGFNFSVHSSSGIPAC